MDMYGGVDPLRVCVYQLRTCSQEQRDYSSKEHGASLRKEVVPMEQFLMTVFANILAGVMVMFISFYFKK